MELPKIFKYIDKEVLLQKSLKISINKDNTQYIIGLNNLHSQPFNTNNVTLDILWNDICFVEDTNRIFTHGKFYDFADKSKVWNHYTL